MPVSALALDWNNASVSEHSECEEDSPPKKNDTFATNLKSVAEINKATTILGKE